MKYKGIELVEITKPQVFDPPKKMLVWGENNREARIDYIYAIGPSSMDLPVRAISDDGSIGTNCYKYCAEIPKTRRATHREVSKWLAQGNGEVTEGDTDNFPFCKSSLYYDSEKSDKPCRYTIRIRKWDDNEWHEPTIDYMGIKESDK